MPRFAEITAAVEHAGPPRPALDPADFVAAASRPQLSGLLNELRADAESDEPLPSLPYRMLRTYPHTGDREPYESRYFARRRRLNAAAVMALVDDGDAHLEWLSDILWAICDEFSWAVPAHHRFNTTLGDDYRYCVDLFAAETAHALSEIVAMLGDRLETPVTRRVLADVNDRVLRPFLDEPRARWWETSTNNWAAVCAGAIGMAALAVEPDPLRLAGFVDRVGRAMESFLSGFGRDGGCFEGTSYWVYGYGYYVYYAEALRERTGIDMLAGTEAIADFPAAVDFGDGYCVSFSDAPARQIPPTGLHSRLRDRLGAKIPHLPRLSSFTDDHCYRWAHLSRTLMWTDVELVGRPAAGGTSWLPELTWVVDRGDNGAIFAAKGGHNGEPHNHLDVGGFILASGGQQLLCDLGAGVYDSDYFGPKRYEAIHTSAAGHSVPIVGGHAQRPGVDKRAEVNHFAADDHRVELSLDLSAVYDGAQVRRDFMWDRAGCLTVTDRFAVDGRPLEELFISLIEPIVDDGRVVWTGEEAEVTLRFHGSWEVKVDRIDTAGHRHEPQTVHRLRLCGVTAASHGFEFRIGTV